ncbi:hypothetical protein J4450_01305 [Candidatus Micrarchaeota archaeon]|nr:hypothetical protein [Candidatus Micrarchaeota archaeon]
MGYKSSRAQVSIELMVMIAAILALFIPLLLHVYFKTNEANEQLAQVQAELASGRIASLINAIGNLGEGSSLIVEVFIPGNVKSVKLKNLGRGGEVIVKASTQSGETDFVNVVRFPVDELTIDKPLQGLKRFNISYDGQKVSVKN